MNTKLYYIVTQHSSKVHEILNQCWGDVGPSSTTLAQHQFRIGSTFRARWDPSKHETLNFYNYDDGTTLSQHLMLAQCCSVAIIIERLNR